MTHIPLVSNSPNTRPPAPPPPSWSLTASVLVLRGAEHGFKFVLRGRFGACLSPLMKLHNLRRQLLLVNYCIPSTQDSAQPLVGA